MESACPSRFLPRLLTIAAAMAIFIPAALPQAQGAPSHLPGFDVISVKPDHSAGQFADEQLPKDGYSATDVTLKGLVSEAYNVREAQITGGPAWIDSDRYDVEARVEGSEVATLNKLNATERFAMLQQVLTDRFRLKTHWETRELPVYALVVAKNGVKFTPAKPGDAGRPDEGSIYGRPGRIEARSIPTVTLANLLTDQNRELGSRIVLDRTGLQGTYDFTLQWTPEDGGTSGEAAENSGPSLFTALQEQLGLKLEPAKAPLQVLVIDRAEQPTAD
jgi:uncharacterized protein (TIGR03435 family)